jgi:hypothetical protein
VRFYRLGPDEAEVQGELELRLYLGRVTRSDPEKLSERSAGPVPPLPAPSAVFDGIEMADRRSCAVRPNLSSWGKLRVRW